MSLINVAQRVRGPRTLTHSVLAVLTVAVGIIAGLLAMHSFNSHATAAGHHDTVAVSTASGTPEHHHDDAAPTALSPALPAMDAGCSTCGGSDPLTWMACVLALLVATLLLARVGRGGRQTPLATIAAATTSQWPVRAHSLPPPPSLTVLCISRT